MKIPTHWELIEELVSLKNLIKRVDLQMGISGVTERAIINKLNKIIRMEKLPIRRMPLAWFKNSQKSGGQND